MSSDDYFNHVTLSTGDILRSMRSMVSPEAVAAVSEGLELVLQGKPAPIPALAAYHLTGATADGCFLGSVWRGKLVLLTMGISTNPYAGERLWPMLHVGYPDLVTQGRTPPDDPWLASRLEVGLDHDLDAARWLGDYERCLAWAWIDRVTPR